MNTIKRAVLIGINYKNDPNKLQAPINDVTNMRNYLISSNHYQRNEIFTMTDDTPGIAYPTRENILNRLTRLVNVANRHNTSEIIYFIMFSGHGKNLKTVTGGNVNDNEEVLAPIDYRIAGYITDKVLRSEFVDKLGTNVKLFMMVDACNSAGILDLRFQYAINPANTHITHSQYPVTRAYVILLTASRDDQVASEVGLDSQGNIIKNNIIRWKNKVFYEVVNSSKIYYYNPNRISRCPFSQAGAQAEFACSNAAALTDTGGVCRLINSGVLPDTGNDGCPTPTPPPVVPVTYASVFTMAFLDIYNDNLTYFEVVNRIREWTRSRGFSQVAQLSSGTLIDSRTSVKMLK